MTAVDRENKSEKCLIKSNNFVDLSRTQSRLDQLFLLTESFIFSQHRMLYHVLHKYIEKSAELGLLSDYNVIRKERTSGNIVSSAHAWCFFQVVVGVAVLVGSGKRSFSDVVFQLCTNA